MATKLVNIHDNDVSSIMLPFDREISVWYDIGQSDLLVIVVPVVPHKAVAEVSKIGNL